MSETTGELLDTKEVAAFFNCTPGAVENWRYKRTGPKYILMSEKVIRYRKSDLIEWMNSRTVDAAA